MRWTDLEQKQLEKYFSTAWTEMTLFKRLHKLNTHRTYEAMTRRLRLMRSNGWVRGKDTCMKSFRIGYFDIESTGLNATFGHMLSWYIKTRGKNEYYSSVITKDEIFKGKSDKRLMEELFIAFEHYDILYTHYGVDRRFDIPFIRTRAYRHGLEAKLPLYMEKFMMDTWPIARNKLRLHNNRLGTVAEALGIKGVKKTPLSARRWEKAMLGDPDALAYIELHNKRDVQLLERVHSKLMYIERPILRSM